MMSTLSLRLSLLAVACLSPLSVARAHEPVCEVAAPVDPVSHPASLDCSESTDTGYSQGNPFPITLIHIDGQPVEKSSGNAYWVMREAAAASGVDIHINSGFRTMSEQEYLYDCYINCSCNDCNQAATPGWSNHQSGHAFDLNTSQGGVYDWLAANGGAYGFTETVPGEPWHWEWWGGGPGGGACDISIPPQGYLDTVDCEKVWGWAQDPDAPDASIDVHIYFNGPAGDPAGIGVSTKANQHRDDLCMALGSCAHGYTMSIPNSLRDGAMHPVFAYGIDLEGQNNPQLSQSPLGFTCGPPALKGVRRHIPNPDVLAAWKFDLFFDLVTVDDPTLQSLPEWEAIPPAPQMIQADDGTPEVWLKDGAVRRHIPNPTVADAWGFDLGTVVVTPAAEVYAIPEGTPVWATPLLVQGPGPEVYQLDDIQCTPTSLEPECQGSTSIGEDPTTSGGTGGSDGGTGDGGTSGGGSGTDETSGGGSGPALPPDSGGTAGEADSGGCACASGDGSSGAGFGLLVLGALWRRRRR